MSNVTTEQVTAAQKKAITQMLGVIDDPQGVGAPQPPLLPAVEGREGDRMSTTSTTAAPQKSNIRKLAELIYNTGNADRIMAALEIVLSSGAGDTLRAMGQKQEGGEDA